MPLIQSKEEVAILLHLELLAHLVVLYLEIKLF